MNILIKLFASNYFISLRKLIFHFSLKISGYKNFGNFYDTGEDYLFSQIKKFNIKNVLDVGAHTGAFSKKLLENENINVIAFEPMKKNFIRLKKLENDYKYRFKCFNIALSNRIGNTKIYYTNPSSQLSSIAINLNKINFLKNKKIKKQNIKIDTLDNLIAKNKKIFKNKIDYIKIDTEGNDFKVLVGALKTIKKHKPQLIQIEMNYHYLFAGENLYQFSKFLVGYEVFQIMPFNNGLLKIDPSRPENNIFHLSNFIFKKKKN